MWISSKEVQYGIAISNFDGKVVPHGLTINVGDTLQIFEQCNNWYRGCHIQRKAIKGIFPASYVQSKPCTVDVEGPHATVTPLDDPVVREVSLVLREWGHMWKRLFVERKAPMYATIYSLMLDLMEARKELMSAALTQDQSLEIKARITAKIDWGNKKLGLDLVPRQDNEPVDYEAISPVELYHLHEESLKISTGATTRGSLRLTKQKKITPNHHLFMSYKNFGCNVGEETELHFQLYDAKTSSFFTERYLMKMSRNGLPLDFERPDQYYALFTDLGGADLMREAYLIVHVYRMGNLRDESSKKSSASVYRRPYGCAVTSVKDILMGNVFDGSSSDLLQRADHLKEMQLRVYTCSESDFPQLHENIIRKQSAKFNVQSSQTNYGLVISLRMLHGDIEEVMKEDPVLFRNMTITRKMGFPDVIMPGDARNDLYVTLNRGDFDKGSKTSGKNIEIKLKAYNGQGDLILECICPGAGERLISRYTSVIFYHCNQPRWNDTIKLDIPIEIYKSMDSHIRLEFRHCSTRDKTEKKMFAFSYLRLVAPDGTALRNAAHELFLWKCDDVNKLDFPQRYLTLPCTTAEINPEIGGNTLGNSYFRRSEKEYIYIDTMLCSTKLTQNAELLSVLQWRDRPDILDLTLKKLMQLPGTEVVNYLQDILDALFSMFEMENGQLIQQAHLVFQALFHIFNLVEDRKFEHFKPVIDTYLSYHFSAVLVFRDLLTCLKETLEVLLSSTSKDQQYFHNCFKVLEYIVKFIVQARLLYTRQTIVDNTLNAVLSQNEFIVLCNRVFDAMQQVLSINFDLISTAQGILLSSIPKVLTELVKVYPQEELCEMFCKLVMSIPVDHPEKLQRKKLRCIREVANSTLINCYECKKSFITMCSLQLLHYLGDRQELKLCSEILADVLKILHDDTRKKVVGTSHNVQTLLSGLLDLIVRILQDSDESVTILIQLPKDLTNTFSRMNQLVACLVTLLKLMDDKHYSTVLKFYRESAQLREFVLQMLTLFEKLVQKSVFPCDWMVMRMNMNQVILLTLQFLSQTLCEQYLKGINFDHELWKMYFSLAVCFLTQPSLQLEKFSEVKRQKVRERYGDMRVQMGYEILAMWENLDNHKLHFVPSMVGPFLEVTLIPETELRKATLPIFYDMMECERSHRGNFKQVESELIDKLDILINENKGDEEYKELFNTILLQKVECESRWNEKDGASFVQSVTRLLERLLDYRKVLEGEENREKRMTCTVNLLNFYKNEINREEMYVRYIHKLSDLQLASRNHTEAAFTMLLHAELLDWGDTELEPEKLYPQQRTWERKEQIYRQIIAYFDIGKSWEYGIPLCEELAQLYKKRVMYKKLSDILQLQATFYEKILEELRPNPEYFRVGFYGQKFPLFLRNKEFVYRGNDYERMGSFQQRILSEFSGASLLNTTTSLTESLRVEESQYIMISSLKPIAELDPVFLEPCVPETVQNFYLFNEVQWFQLDRPFHRGEKDEANEFKTLCIERTKLCTSNKLPGILRWFEVIESQTYTLSPIETAIDAMEKKNREIQMLTTACASQKFQNLKTLTMVLNGTIDAAVQGGIRKYQEAFFTDEFAVSSPEHVKHVSELKTKFLEQVQLLNHSLKVHGRLVPEVSPDVQPLHNRLIELFKAMKQGIKETGSPNMARLQGVSDALTHIARPKSGSSTSSKSTSISPSGSNRSSDILLSESMDNISVDSGISNSTNQISDPHLPNTMIGFASLGLQSTAFKSTTSSLNCLSSSSSGSSIHHNTACTCSAPRTGGVNSRKQQQQQHPPPLIHYPSRSNCCCHGGNIAHRRPLSAVYGGSSSSKGSGAGSGTGGGVGSGSVGKADEYGSFFQSKDSLRCHAGSVFYVSSPVQTNAPAQASVIRPPSEPSLTTKFTSSMKGAPSSVSLDSATGRIAGRSFPGFTSGMNGSTPPKPPPRRTPLTNGNPERDSSPVTPRTGPSLPPRKKSVGMSISASSTRTRTITDESPLSTPTSKHESAEMFQYKVTSPITPTPKSMNSSVNSPLSLSSSSHGKNLAADISPGNTRNSSVNNGLSASPIAISTSPSATTTTVPLLSSSPLYGSNAIPNQYVDLPNSSSSIDPSNIVINMKHSSITGKEQVATRQQSAPPIPLKKRSSSASAPPGGLLGDLSIVPHSASLDEMEPPPIPTRHTPQKPPPTAPRVKSSLSSPK